MHDHSYSYAFTATDILFGNGSAALLSTPHSGDSACGNLLLSALLAPGRAHLLHREPIPTPESLLDGSYKRQFARGLKQQDWVFLVPRVPQNRKEPNYTVVFSTGGKPGPYLRELLKGDARLDMGDETMFPKAAWRQALISVDWPGMVDPPKRIATCVDHDHQLVTRRDFAQQVARIIASFFCDAQRTNSKSAAKSTSFQILDSSTKAWNLIGFDFMNLRVIGLNHYHNTWIPVLAVDIHH